MKKIKIVQFILFAVIGLTSYAQVEGVSANNPRYFIDEEIILGEASVGSFSLQGTNGLDVDKLSPTLLKEETSSAKLYLKLDLGEDYVVKVPGSGEDFGIDFELEYRFSNELMWHSLEYELNTEVPEVLHVVDLTNQLNGANNLNIEIRAVQNSLSVDNGTSTFFNNLIDNNLRFKATFVREYNIDVRLASNDNLTSPLVLSPVLSAGTSTKRQTFSWTSNHNYPNYEIQILRIFNEESSNTDLFIAKNVKLDWNKALKIETQSYKKTIELILAEGTGLYTWRVRPIGTYYDGGIGNADNYGEWSAHQPQYVPIPENSTDPNTTILNLDQNSLNVFFYAEPDDNKNWNYTRVFTEGDETGEQGVRTSEGITYADGLLRTRQAQQYNSSENTTIVSQTISDYSGRPALTTLPVPLESTDLNGYKETFVQNSEGTVYTANDYDIIKEENINGTTVIIDNVSNPQPIKDNNTKFQYYNGDRTDGVADAEGYAFSRTIFKTDGTGRAAETSGVGKKHAIGDRAGGKGRTTTVLYSSPSDAELIRIFGDEAPLAESVIKTITKDPNDVISLAYTSKEGKTIATALISDETENLLELNGNDNVFTVVNSTNQNVLNYNKFVSAKRIAIVLDNTEVTLGYEVKSVTTPSCGGNCNFKVQFYLTDLTNGIKYKSNSYDLPSANSSLSITPQAPLVLTDITGNATTITSIDGKFNLDVGEYLITKEVSSNINLATIAQQALDRADQIETILLDITDQMDAVNNQEDLDDFIVYLSNMSYSFPEGFSVSYNSTTKTLNIVNNGASSSESFGSCSDCGTSSITIPTPDRCEVCEGLDGNGGVDAIRDPFKASNPTGEIAYNTSDWNAIKTLVDNHFITYLIEKLNATETTQLVPLSPQGVQNRLTKIAPGFTQESLAYMLTNMLASRYYTGNIKYESGSGFRAAINAEGDLERIDKDGDFESTTGGVFDGVVNIANFPLIAEDEYNYDCEKLYNCWIQAVDMINSFDFEDGVNIMDAYNDENADGQTSEDHADDPDAQEGSSSGNALLDFIISRKMRKFNDSDGKLSQAELEAIVSLPNLFMNCAGYQFAEIIDDEHLGNLPNDYSTTTPYGTGVTLTNILPNVPSSGLLGSYAPKMMAFDSDPNGTNHQPEQVTDCNNIDFDQLNYSYITKPEWMFKYFVYNAYGKTGISDIDNYVLTQRAVEIASNYKDLSLQCGATPLCFEVNYYDHNSWNRGQRLNFYYQISGAKKTVEECEDSQEATPSVVDLTLTEFDLLLLVKEELKSAVESCEGRRGEIQSRLITALEGACYEIVEDCDASSGTQVNELGLEAMTDAVVEQCEAKVETVILKIFANTDDIHSASSTATYPDPAYGSEIYGPDHTTAPNVSPEFPYHNIIECCAYDETGTPIVPNLTKRKITLFAPCDQAILDQVNGWSFIPYIPPLAGCTNNTATPEWHPNFNDSQLESTPCDPNGNGDCPGVNQECTNSQYSTTENKKYSSTIEIEASTNP